MIERNESFKEKMLRKSRGIVDRKRKLLEESSLDLRDSSRHDRVYERMGRASKLQLNLDETDEQPLPTPFINTFRPDEIDLNKHQLPSNFSFKDSIDIDEHSNLP